MRDFSKALLSTVLIIVIIAVLSLFTVESLTQSEYYHCNDNKNRESLAGTIDMLFVGSSEGMNGFNTHIIDEELGGVCYNMCGPATDIKPRYNFIKQEIEKNPIKTVVFSIEKDTINQPVGRVESNMYAIPRNYKFFDRAGLFFNGVPYENIESLFGIYMNDGLYVLNSKLVGEHSFLGTVGSKGNVKYEEKGYRRENANDITIPERQIVETYNTIQVKTDNYATNDKYLKQIIDLCKDNNIRLIFVVAVFSDSEIWHFDGWNRFHDHLKDLSNENGVEYYNFDLIKTRYKLFNDSVSFANSDHLSGEGSDAFSHLFCDILKKIGSGEDVSDLFYSSYEEMKEDSPYMAYYKAHCND